MTLTNLRLHNSIISHAQIETVARVLNIQEANPDILRSKCFERTYQLCQRGEWSIIEPILKELSVLVDSIGRTLLLRAVMIQDDAVVRGLTERSVGLTTTDRFGRTILHYLGFEVGGISSEHYSALITAKLVDQYSQKAIDPLLKEKKEFENLCKSELAQLDDIAKMLNSSSSSKPTIIQTMMQPKAIYYGLSFANPMLPRVSGYYYPIAASALPQGTTNYYSRMQRTATQQRIIGYCPVLIIPIAQQATLNPQLSGMVRLHGMIERHRRMFACFHPQILMYLKLLEEFQRSAGNPEAKATNEEFQKRFSTVYGFNPVVDGEFSEENLLTHAKNGQDKEVDRFLESCPTRFVLNFRGILNLVNFLFCLAKEYHFLREYSRAIKVLDTIFLVPKTVQDSHQELFADINRVAGECHFLVPNQKGYAVAQKYFDAAIDICDRSSTDMSHVRYRCYSDRAGLYCFLGRIEVAEKDCRAVVEFTKANDMPSYPYFHCQALCRLSTVLYSRKQYNQAADFAKQAVDLCKKKGADTDPKGKNVYRHALSDLGKSLYALKDLDGALTCIDKAEKFCDIANIKNDDHSRLLLNKGNIWEEKNDIEQALRNFHGSYEKAIQGSRSQAFSAAALGTCYLKIKHFEKAVRWSKEAIDLFAELQSVLPHDNWQITIFELHVEAYRDLERALVGANRLHEALIISDKRRARVYAHSLSLRISPGPEMLSDLTIPEICDVAKQCNTILVIYSVLDGKSGLCWVISPEKIDTVEINVENIFPHGLDGFLSEGSYRGPNNKHSLPIVDLYKQLNRLAKISRSSSSNDEWEEMKKEAKKAALQEEAQICEEFLTHLPKNFTLPLESDPSSDEWDRILLNAKKAASEEGPKIQAQFHSYLKDRYRELIQPIANLLPKPHGGTVTFIPDSSMAMLPFAIFEREDGRYFVENYASLVAPSIRIVSLLEKLRQQRSKEKPLAKAVVACNPKSKFVQELKTGDKEGLVVKDLLKTDTMHLMLGADATVTHILSSIEDAQWIHLSCHGEIEDKEAVLINPSSLYKGYLYLTPDDKYETGILYAEEISKIKLQAELVFLSACYSGQGNSEYIHEGHIGLTRAFASGGALTSVSSYWKLPDTEENIELIKTFYSHVLGSGVPKVGKAVALRKSMVEAIDRYRENPDKWGALFLTGIN